MTSTDMSKSEAGVAAAESSGKTEAASTVASSAVVVASSADCVATTVQQLVCHLPFMTSGHMLLFCSILCACYHVTVITAPDPGDVSNGGVEA